MLEIKNSAFPSPDQWSIIISGMRNPMNSWDKGDSQTGYITEGFDFYADTEDGLMIKPDKIEHTFLLGKNDKKLAKNLINAGPEHSKFLRQLPVTLEITAPLYWWKQCDQYKVGTTTDSCSTMHKLTYKPFEAADFSTDHMEEIDKNELGRGDIIPDIDTTVHELNFFRNKYLETGDKNYWFIINEYLPQNYMQMRTWSANYSVLFNICKQRAGHKLSEWNTFIEWIIENVPYFKELCFDKLCEVSEPFKKLFNSTLEAEKNSEENKLMKEYKALKEAFEK